MGLQKKIKIGIDEAGRWPWFWPVVSACFCLNPEKIPSKEFISKLQDSKKLTSKQREKIFSQIVTLANEEIPSIFFGIGVVDNFVIDSINIRQANKEAMRRALLEILRKINQDDIDSVVIDGKDNYSFDELKKKPLYIIWWDAKVAEIAWASIIAKVFRDKIIDTYACLYPKMSLENHKWYGTKKHSDFLETKANISSFHRLTYAPVKKILEHKRKLLLHVCCWPDATIPIVTLKEKFDITCFWYDPNIHPKSEYDRRLKAFKKVCEIEKIPYIEGEYDIKTFFSKIKGFEKCKEKWERCQKCYDFRLEKTAFLASELNINYWTTSLTISPHKDVKKIFEIGEKYNLENIKSQFLAFDFRKDNGFVKSVEYTKKNNIYRQNYCGCMYSENFLWNGKEI